MIGAMTHRTRSHEASARARASSGESPPINDARIDRLYERTTTKTVRMVWKNGGAVLMIWRDGAWRIAEE